jgi:cell division protein FtsZ
LIHNLAHPDANIIFGTVIDDDMKEMVKVTVIATGFDPKPAAHAVTPEDFPAIHEKTPPAFRVKRETPPYVFEPKGNETLWQRPAWEKKWEPYETPSFIRRNRKTSLRKSLDDYS